jgi:hypothetical protein
MNWTDVLKKNNKEFQKKIPEKIIEDNTEEEIDYNIKDYEDEFDTLHSYDIVEIKIDFKDYIDNLSLPFLDKDINSPFNNNNIFYDFIKYNSVNLINIKNNVEKENEEYLNELYDEEDNYTVDICDNYYDKKEK